MAGFMNGDVRFERWGTSGYLYLGFRYVVDLTPGAAPVARRANSFLVKLCELVPHAKPAPRDPVGDRAFRWSDGQLGGKRDVPVREVLSVRHL